jgi:hypothetical protein
MNDISKDSKNAIDIFLKRIISYSYDGAIRGIRKILERGPSGRAKQVKRSKIFEWYQELDEKDRQIVLDIIEESVRLSVFSFLVVLDNKAGGPPLDHTSDFALYLQTYESDDERIKYSPSISTRLNMSYTVGGELHDEFNHLLQFRETRDKEGM